MKQAWAISDEEVGNENGLLGNLGSAINAAVNQLAVFNFGETNKMSVACSMKVLMETDEDVNACAILPRRSP